MDGPSTTRSSAGGRIACLKFMTTNMPSSFDVATPAMSGYAAHWPRSMKPPARAISIERIDIARRKTPTRRTTPTTKATQSHGPD